ncbi:fructosamine kinase family protein [Pleomorphovibrio marinus]|uniref:fructosamine kinase family protein n=1 Tax=Pleomorphovibrio marinus TaxID=2164132 RepID=UPI000E0AD10C|nr:fructosamine kinase family protein [Pleomorphovibrio marinus]
MEDFFNQVFLRVFGKEPVLQQYRMIAAGTINQAIYLHTDRGEFMLKVNHQEDSDIFKREDEGLKLLRENCGLLVPQTLYEGRLEDRNYLLMEWVKGVKPSEDYSQVLGEGMAELHMATQNQFGLEVDNYISILPQSNRAHQDWEDFFIAERLEPMLQRALYEGLVDETFMGRFRGIYPKLSSVFPKEKPALLHGDLWAGNVITGPNGLPALIDPAVYFGHREVDLAFSKLFGGFDNKFYQSYHSVFPLEPGFEERVEIYNLYPLLVHVNLFGKSYLSGVQRTIKRWLA